MLFLAILISSCSKDDDELITNEYNKGLLKKIEHNIGSQVVYYTESKQISELRIYSTETIYTYNVTYTDNKAVTINQTQYFIDGSGNNYEINHTISYNDNEIILTPTTTGVFSNKIIINTTDRYVDSYRVYRYDNLDLFDGNKFIRNSNNNIESIVSITNIKENEVDLYYAYSEYNKEVTLKPVFNPIFDDIYVSLYKIFDLKISKDNPSKCMLYLDNEVLDIAIQSIDFEYADNKKNVSKGIMHHPTCSYEYNFEYYQ